MQKDTEVIHRKVKGGTKITCYLKWNQSEFSETRRMKDLAKKTLKKRYQNGSPVLRCVTLNTPAKRSSADEAHARVNRRTDRRCASVTADCGRDRLSDEAGSREHAQTSPECTAAVRQQGC